MRNLFALVALVCAIPLLAQQATLRNADNQDGTLNLNEMQFSVPDGWKLVQDGRSDNTVFIGLSKGDQYITLFAKPATGLNLKSFYTAQAQFSSSDTTESYGPLNWHALDSLRKPGQRASAVYVHGFLTEFHGYTYYGFSHASTADAAKQGASQLLSTLILPMRSSRSLTDEHYTGHNYYFGWGDATGSPDEMVNEVKYDVKHTHDIFTKDIGGGYISTTLNGSDANESSIPKTWRDLTSKMTSDDMYVQYSSGHGYEGGLAVGVTHSQIRDAILAMPCRELVVFTMACFSGGLVDAFNQSKSQWQDWQSKGRTLFVLTSSKADEESSTGPGTDPGEPNGPDGSAGSAFGFSLWKALIGEADGYVDGVKDNFISLAEIRDYTTYRTQQVGGHTPQVTGVYNDNLIMNKVPSAAFVAELEKEGSTRGLTEAQIMKKIQELDQELAVH